MSLTSLRSQLNQVLRQRDLARQTRIQEAKTLRVARKALGNVQKGQQILQALAQEIQSRTHKDLARVVSKCLQGVFEDDYRLQVEFVQRRGKTEAEFIYQLGKQTINPRTTSGVLREVTALALRLASLIMTMPACRRLLILDEPFPGLDRGKIGKMGKLVKTLAGELNTQILLTTHSEHLEVGRVIQL